MPDGVLDLPSFDNFRLYSWHHLCCLRHHQVKR